jgi:hypothetical protein
MSQLEIVLRDIASHPECIVEPRKDLPKMMSAHRLKSELLEFYLLCGGAVIGVNSISPLHVMSPELFVPAVERLYNLTNLPDEVQIAARSDISYSQYILAYRDTSDGEFVSIDVDQGAYGIVRDANYLDFPHGKKLADSLSAFLRVELLNLGGTG